jgi:hypothetical protein
MGIGLACFIARDIRGSEKPTRPQDPAEEEARAVAQLRSQGLSLRRVAAELERLGVRSRTGRGFAPVQVKRMVG